MFRWAAITLILNPSLSSLPPFVKVFTTRSTRPPDIREATSFPAASSLARLSPGVTPGPSPRLAYLGHGLRLDAVGTEVRGRSPRRVKTPSGPGESPRGFHPRRLVTVGEGYERRHSRVGPGDSLRQKRLPESFLHGASEPHNLPRRLHVGPNYRVHGHLGPGKCGHLDGEEARRKPEAARVAVGSQTLAQGKPHGHPYHGKPRYLGHEGDGPRDPRVELQAVDGIAVHDVLNIGYA